MGAPSEAETEAETGAEAERPHRPALARRLPWLVLAVGLLGEAAVSIVQDRRLWFFRDDFSYLFGNGLGDHPVTTLLTPHNEHWSTIPILVLRVMWHVFGLRHYLPYALMPLLLHLSVAICLATLVRRAGAGPWTAVLTSLVFAYLAGGAGAENTLWAFQIGFIGSCLGGLLALLCFDVSLVRSEGRWGGRWFWAGTGFLVAALMCSGMGVPMVVACGAWALFRCGWWDAVRVIAVPLVVYVVWYLGWGHVGFGSAPPLTQGLERAPVAAANGLTNVWTAATSVPYVGTVVLLVLVVAVVLVRNRQRPLAVLGAGGLVGLLVEYLVVGFGRSKDDLVYVQHSRYLYIGLALSAPALACALHLVAARLRRRPGVTAAGWLVAVVLVVVIGSIETANFAASRRAADPDRRQELLAAAVLIRQSAPILSDRIDPTDIYRHPAMSVAGFEAAHALAKLPAGRPGARAMFEERSILEVSVRDSSMHVPRTSTYHWVNHRTANDPPATGPAPAAGRGCTIRATPGPARLVVPLGPQGGQVEIDLPRPPQVGQAVLTQVVRHGQRGVRLRWPLRSTWGLGSQRLFVASTIHHATLVVTLPAGRVTVCGPRAPA